MDKVQNSARFVRMQTLCNQIFDLLRAGGSPNITSVHRPSGFVLQISIFRFI